MDLATTTHNSRSCTTTPISKSHESDTDTETPLQTHLSKALSLTTATATANGRLPLYRECLKNHAASLGGLALDGCGEFMPTSNASSLDPTSLKCAACGCHRNFHRRDTTSHRPIPPPALHWASSPSPTPSSPASPTPQQSFFPTSATNVLLALSTGNPSSVAPTVMNPHGKKRARTKFSEEQKEKMLAFAEKLGWKMLNRGGDDGIVEEFCNEIGVKRKVFKVWMHNNKNRREKASNGHNNTNKFEVFVNGSEYGSLIDRYRIESKVSVPGSTTDASSPSSS